MAEYFRGPALARPPRLAPTGRSRQRVVLPLLLLTLIGPGWWWTQRAAPAPIASAAPAPTPVDGQRADRQRADPPRTGPPQTVRQKAGRVRVDRVAADRAEADRPTADPQAADRPAAAAPRRLSGYELVGPRRTGCVRLIVGLDVSSSMTGYRAVRDAALTELLRWLRTNLRPDDQIAVIDFAGSAGVRQPPTPVTLPIRLGPPAAVISGSRLRPLLDTAAGLPSTACATTVILLSDGQLDDLPTSPAESTALLTARRITHIRLLAPDKSISVPRQWTAALPSARPVYFDGRDPDDTALAIGHTVGELVERTLRPRRSYKE